MADETLERRALLGALAATALWPLASRQARAAALPGNSVYHLQAALTDQDGRAVGLDVARGQVVLASMFYTSCDMVCPLIFETIRLNLKALPAAQRERTRVLMISFDAARDTVAQLKATALARGCDERWTLARADDTTARKIAAVLGVQYRRLASGEFNHSSEIEVLDTEGRIVFRSAKMGMADPALLEAVQRLPAAATTRSLRP